MNAETATVVYSYFFVFVSLLGVGAYLLKTYVERQTKELQSQLQKIMYALYNDGKTGLINKVDDLLENQHRIRVDVEVLKARINE